MSRSRLTVLFAALFLSTPLHAAAPGVYAITGGTLHTASGPDVANGVVLIRGGLIEAAGANVAIPADATVIDVHGAHVYPGLIDAQTSLGFPSPVAQVRRRGPQPQTQRAAEPLPETSAAFQAIRTAKISDDDLDAWRAAGVLTVVTAPSFGIFNGQSAVLNLDADPDSRAIKTPAAQQISFNPRPSWTFPDSLMGVIADIRQTMLDAQQYATGRAIYEKNPAGIKRPETSETLAALAPALSREVPVVFVADTDLMIRRAMAIAREFNLRMIVSGARQGYAMADELRAMPVLVSVKWPAPPLRREDAEDQPLRVIRDRQMAPTTPSVLAKSGVTFALVSGAGKAGDFIPGIRKAIDNGLSADDALRAVTITPARIFGVDRQLGSLDRGKIANVVISDKPIFEKQAKVTRVFVDGREVRLQAPEKRAAESAPSPIDGVWSLSVRTPKGEVAITATLHSEDGRLTGNYSGERGSGDIRNGSFDGSVAEFTISIRDPQGSESGDWIFHGTLADSKLSGTVSTNLGTFEFSGSKGR